MTLYFGQSSHTANAFQISHASNRPFQASLDALRSAIGDAGMKVLHEIDPQGALDGIGQSIGGARLVFFFHPELLARLLRIDVSAIVEAPLKMALIEMPDGTVSMRIADPAAAMARYGNPALAAFGEELAQTCRQLMAVAA